MPATWEAFQDYRMNAMRLSGPEIELLRLLITDDRDAATAWLNEKGWLNAETGKKSREMNELEGKLEQLGIKL